MSIFFGICLLGVAYWMQFSRKKKQFNRRNSSGVEEFKSYEDSLVTGALDKLVGFTGAILFLLGLGLVAYGIWG